MSRGRRQASVVDAPEESTKDVTFVGGTGAGSNGTLPVGLVHNGDSCIRMKADCYRAKGGKAVVSWNMS